MQNANACLNIIIILLSVHTFVSTELHCLAPFGNCARIIPAFKYQFTKIANLITLWDYPASAPILQQSALRLKKPPKI